MSEMGDARGTLSGDEPVTEEASARGTLSGDEEAAPRGTLSGDPGGTLSGDAPGTQDAPLDETDADAVPTSLPDLAIERELGRGGMGVVYLATQESLARPVAVKTLLGAHASGPAAQKFAEEARTTGRLAHPNIPPVHGFGRDDRGRAYLSMKLVKGVEWARLQEPRNDDERARAAAIDLAGHLAILARVADAIAFAHAEGVLHRDLKPENVMVGEFGEVLVMDWGIALDMRARDARRAEEDAARARGEEPPKEPPRGPVGTPAYMPPEMARADPAAQGPWTDVYLLGGLLYELLTGETPHAGASVLDTLLAAGQGDVTAPALRARPGRRVPEDLAEVAMRALDKDPARRFPSARAFADALSEFGAHEASRLLSGAARAGLKETAARIAAGGAEAPAVEVYPALAASAAELAQARKLWAANPEAADGLVEARLLYARFAAERGDLELAEAQLQTLRREEAEALAAGRKAPPRRGDVAEAEARVLALRRSRAREQARRKRALVGLAAAVVIAACAVVLGLFESRRASETAAARARRERAVAEAEGAVWREKDERIGVYERALAIDDTWVEGFTELARAHVNVVEEVDLADPPRARKHYALALANFERAVTLAPEDPDKVNDHAYVLEMTDRTDEARLQYGRVVALAPDALAGIDAALWIALDDGRVHDVERLATERLARESMGLARFQRAVGRLVSGRFEDALADARAAEEMSPRDSWYVSLVAVCLFALGREKEGADKLVIAARGFPRLPHVGALLAWHAARKGDLARARGLALRTAAERVELAGVNIALRPAWRALVKGPPAVATLGRAIMLEDRWEALVPTATPRALALRRRGEERFAKGELEGALSDAERALGDDPADGAARLLRARCFMAFEQPDAAKSDLGVADRLSPDRAADVAAARAELKRMKAGER